MNLGGGGGHQSKRSSSSVKYCLNTIFEELNKIMTVVSKQLIVLANILIGYLRIQVGNPTAAPTGLVSFKFSSKGVN
jgi:hypothetical protein